MKFVFSQQSHVTVLLICSFFNICWTSKFTQEVDNNDRSNGKVSVSKDSKDQKSEHADPPIAEESQKRFFSPLPIYTEVVTPGPQHAANNLENEYFESLLQDPKMVTPLLKILKELRRRDQERKSKRLKENDAKKGIVTLNGIDNKQNSRNLPSALRHHKDYDNLYGHKNSLTPFPELVTPNFPKFEIPKLSLTLDETLSNKIKSESFDKNQINDSGNPENNVDVYVVENNKGSNFVSNAPNPENLPEFEKEVSKKMMDEELNKHGETEKRDFQNNIRFGNVPKKIENLKNWNPVDKNFNEFPNFISEQQFNRRSPDGNFEQPTKSNKHMEKKGKFILVKDLETPTLPDQAKFRQTVNVKFGQKLKNSKTLADIKVPIVRPVIKSVEVNVSDKQEQENEDFKTDDNGSILNLKGGKIRRRFKIWPGNTNRRHELVKAFMEARSVEATTRPSQLKQGVETEKKNLFKKVRKNSEIFMENKRKNAKTIADKDMQLFEIDTQTDLEPRKEKKGEVEFESFRRPLERGSIKSDIQKNLDSGKDIESTVVKIFKTTGSVSGVRESGQKAFDVGPKRNTKSELGWFPMIREKHNKEEQSVSDHYGWKPMKPVFRAEAQRNNAQGLSPSRDRMFRNKKSYLNNRQNIPNFRFGIPKKPSTLKIQNHGAVLNRSPGGIMPKNPIRPTALTASGFGGRKSDTKIRRNPQKDHFKRIKLEYEPRLRYKDIESGFFGLKTKYASKFAQNPYFGRPGNATPVPKRSANTDQPKKVVKQIHSNIQKSDAQDSKSITRVNARVRSNKKEGFEKVKDDELITSLFQNSEGSPKEKIDKTTMNNIRTEKLRMRLMEELEKVRLKEEEPITALFQDFENDPKEKIIKTSMNEISTKTPRRKSVKEFEKLKDDEPITSLFQNFDGVPEEKIIKTLKNEIETETPRIEPVKGVENLKDDEPITSLFRKSEGAPKEKIIETSKNKIRTKMPKMRPVNEIVKNKKGVVKKKPKNKNWKNFKGETYDFGFDAAEGEYRQFRREERFPDGSVRGFYGYKEPAGTYRIVDFYADKTGYHADEKILSKLPKKYQ